MKKQGTDNLMNPRASLSPLTDAELAAQATVHPELLHHAHILVAGASGLIGSLLVSTLHDLNEKLGLELTIVAVARHTQHMQELFSHCADVHIVSLDVGDSQQVAAFARGLSEKPLTHIIHAASPANPSLFAHSPVETMNSNIQGLINLVSLARQGTPARFVYISSGEVYGYTHGWHVMKEDEQGELDPLSVRSCYPQAKRASETLGVSAMSEYNIPFVIARLSHVFGPGFLGSDNRISADFFKRAAAGQPIELRSAGLDHRTFIYVSDCVSGILSLLTVGQAGVAYNVTNSDNLTTVADFSSLIAITAHVPFSHGQAQPGWQENTSLQRATALDDTRLKQLGWMPTVSLEEGITRTLSWLRGELNPHRNESA